MQVCLLLSLSLSFHFLFSFLSNSSLIIAWLCRWDMFSTGETPECLGAGVLPFILVLSLFPLFFFVRPESNHCLVSSLGYPWCFEGSNLIVGWLGILKSCWCWKWCWTKSASIFCEHAFCVSSTGYMETWLNKISLEEMLWLKSFSFHQTFIWSLIKQRSCFIF